MTDTTAYPAADLKDPAADKQIEQSAGAILTDGERQSICEALVTIGAFDLRPSDSSPDVLQAAVGRVKDLSANALLDIVSLAPAEDLPSLLQGVNKLGFAHPLVTGISATGMLFLMAYYNRMVNTEEGRRGIAIWQLMMPEKERNYDAFSGLLGCGKNRIYRGVDELASNGLAGRSDHPNAPGAGRPSAQDDFAKYMAGMAAGAGLPPDELLRRQVERECVQPAAESPDDTVLAGSDPVKPEAPGKPREHIPRAMDLLDAVIGRIDDEAKRFRFGRSTCLHEIREYALQQKDLLKEASGIWMPAPDADGDGLNGAEPGSTYHPDIEKENQDMCLCILGKTSLMIAGMCNSLMQAWDALDPSLSAYHLAKGLRKGFKLNAYKPDIAAQWHGYSLLMQDRERIKEAGGLADNTDGNRPGAIGKSKQIDRAALKESTSKDCGTLISRCEKELEHRSLFKNKEIHGALGMLNHIRACLQGMESNDTGGGDAPAIAFYAMNFLHHLFHRWIGEWDGGDDFQTARSVCKQMLSYENIISSYLDEYERERRKPSKDQGTEMESAAEAGAGQGNEKEASQADDEMAEGFRESVLQRAGAVRETLTQLLDNLRIGKERRRKNKQSKQTAEDMATIDSAISTIESVLAKFNGLVEETSSSSRINAWNALASVIGALGPMGGKWLSNWKKPAAACRPTFTIAKIVGASITAGKNQRYIAKAWSLFESQSRGSGGSGNDGPGYVTLDSMDADNLFAPGGRLGCAKRNELIRKFWNEGKDPTDLGVWIEFIIGVEFDRNYGDPSSRGKYCHLTREELQNAFAFLTGRIYSQTTLWNHLTKKMGYSCRQCAKLDQAGDAHPLRDEQFRNIQSARDSIDPEKTLLISIDTKAFVVLGRLKHDDAVLLCSPDGKVYRVYDHDFPFLMSDIYPNGTDLVDESRMQERAVLHPVGVYCPNDNTGYVSLVLGKDTAESMRALIQKVIDDKKATSMPALDSVLILADGGGANMSGGIVWKSELLDLAEGNGIDIQVCHFPPGTSKHNPIEHKMFSFLSIHWRGKPFLDIEHVVRYIQETTTKAFLKITCWFDSRRYLKNSEKKEAGLLVPTKDELEARAKGRISHPFEQGTDLYKWNYTIYHAVPDQNI